MNLGIAMDCHSYIYTYMYLSKTDKEFKNVSCYACCAAKPLTEYRQVAAEQSASVAMALLYLLLQVSLVVASPHCETHSKGNVMLQLGILASTESI